ncbi:ladinin-1 isoform 1-T1 [Menidia menidia]
MSISRKNWSALSSLARQWTMEDEEEVEREKRRRVKTSCSAEPDADSSPTPKSTGTDSSTETAQGLSSAEQMQLDFVEMLRVRDEKRRRRHVETLRRQKECGDDEWPSKEEDARLVLLGELDEDKASVHEPQPSPETSTSALPKDNTRPNMAKTQQENGDSLRRDPDRDPKPASNPARKFVSSVSISLDKSSGPTTPMSPLSPTASVSPREHWPSPCQSPSPQGRQSPVQNGHTQVTSVNGTSTNGNFEQAAKPAFIRQSSRTISFRMMRKKEEESTPLQRSASVRIASKKFESNTDQNEDEDKASSFQRNSRQRISSRTIQEKMERLAQAAQKSELTRSPDVTQRTLFLLEEVSRKRGLFEKEQPTQSPTSPGVTRQEFRGFTSGISDRINRFLHKTNPTGSTLTTTDLRHVDITSKRSLFENKGEESVSKVSLGKSK